MSVACDKALSEVVASCEDSRSIARLQCLGCCMHLTSAGCTAGMRTRTEQAALEKKEAAVIGRDDSTAMEVSDANAKLAAEALLRGLSKRMDSNIMHEIEVVAVSADVDTAKLSLLRKGWYQQATYFFE